MEELSELLVLRLAEPLKIAPAAEDELTLLHEAPEYALCYVALTAPGGEALAAKRYCELRERTAALLREAAAGQSALPYRCGLCLPDGGIVLLAISRDGQRLSAENVRQFLTELLKQTEEWLRLETQLELHALWTIGDSSAYPQRTLVRLKNALRYFDYMGTLPGLVDMLPAFQERNHSRLWDLMHSNAEEFLDCVLANDDEAAIACMEKMLLVIDGWIVPSVDIFLADVQHYLDEIVSQLKTCFGDRVPDNYGIQRLFDTQNRKELSVFLHKLVYEMFFTIRKNTSTAVFRRNIAIREAMDANIGSYTLTPSALAARYQISPQLLSVQFKKCFGKTPLQYIEHKRVALAKSYLREPALTLEQICERVGYGSVSTLHRSFRKLCGQSPGEYRRSLQTASPPPEDRKRPEEKGI